MPKRFDGLSKILHCVLDGVSRRNLAQRYAHFRTLGNIVGNTSQKQYLCLIFFDIFLSASSFRQIKSNQAYCRLKKASPTTDNFEPAQALHAILDTPMILDVSRNGACGSLLRSALPRYWNNERLLLSP
jgi:hypothetical protein